MADPLRCGWCGKLFAATNRRGPVPTFCTPACRQRAFADRRSVVVHVERFVLGRFRDLHRDEYEKAWADATRLTGEITDA